MMPEPLFARRGAGPTSNLAARRRRASRSGAALVIVLNLVVLLSLIVIALATTARIDRSAARLSLDSVRAGILAQNGVDHAVAILRTEIGQTNRPWSLQPGQLAVPPPGVNGPLTRIVPLSSGATTNSANAYNLNLPTLGEPSNRLIADTTAPLRVQWVYVRENGDREATDTPAADAANPVTGRYAFWVDSESSKINLNLAGQPAGNTNAPAHPSHVNLTALPAFTPAVATAIRTPVEAGQFYNSPEDPTAVARNDPALQNDADAIASAVRAERDVITHYNHDPNLTFFGEPRIVLTTRAELAGGRPFLDIAKNSNWVPGGSGDVALIKNLSDTKVSATLERMTNYLGRVDWPMTSGTGLQDKYAASASFSDADKNRILIQHAVNIIDYVRAKESGRTLTEKLVGTYAAKPAFQFSYWGTSNDLTGTGRNPCITEMGIWIGETPNAVAVHPHIENAYPYAKHFPGIFKVELYLPPRYGITSLDLTKYQIKFRYNHSWGKWGTGPDGPTQTEVQKALNAAFEKPYPIASSYCSPNSVLKAGGYVTISVPLNVLSIDKEIVTDENGEEKTQVKRPTNLGLRVSLHDPTGSSGYWFEDAPYLWQAKDKLIQYQVDPTNIPPEDITSAEVDDPRINKSNQDWLQRDPGTGNTFEARNERTRVGLVGGGSPPQDTDASGRVSEASLFMPAPAGTPSNPEGRVLSVAELGYVVTGMRGVAKAGLPWRTLRLQPARHATDQVPDWALLDLFTVPVADNSPASALYKLADGSVGGRINANASLEPFGNVQRTEVVEALLKGVLPGHDSLAENIATKKRAAGGQEFGAAGFYDLPGEIAEVEGVADAGEASEENLRKIVDRITTQGNVFTVYTVGQALRQTPSGGVLVLGEQRQQVMVERAVETNAAPYRVTFRPIYTRDLMR